MRKITIGVILLILIAGFAMSTAIAADGNKIVVTYGETTYNNHDYKTIVDNYFTNHSKIDVKDVLVKIISASDVNNISASFSNRTYNSNQIFSCALVDLSDTGDLEVDVDSSKINVITEDMYKSALKSAGITKGHVYVTSPISATGESALAGVMNCYEKATNTTIPADVKEAANNEIATEAQIVNNSHVSSKDLGDVVDQVKEEVSDKNTTNRSQVESIVNSVLKEHNMNLSQDDVDLLVDSVIQTQAAQHSANLYKEKLSNALGDNGSIFDEILKFFGL